MSALTRARVLRQALAGLFIGALVAVGTGARAQDAPPLWEVV